jgi:hypothetical protein
MPAYPVSYSMKGHPMLKALKASLAKEKAYLLAKSGTMAAYSKRGPVGLEVVEALCTAIEDQQRQIDELKKALSK